MPGARQFHARLVRYHIQGYEYSIITPDEDVYGEVLSAMHNYNDLRACRLGLPGGGVPPLGGAASYDFAAYTPAEEAQYMQDAYDFAQAERLARGLDALPPRAAGSYALVVAPAVPAGPAAPVAGAAPAAPVAPAAPAFRGAAPAGGCWIVDEPTDSNDVGDEV